MALVDAKSRTCTIHKGRTHPPNESSVYEIGSITKVFTTLLLAIAIQQQQQQQNASHNAIAMNVPIVEILPKKMSSSLRHFPREITPERLATHTSGLPTLPTDWNFRWNMYRHSTNPYSAYHEDNLATTLQKYHDPNPQGIGNAFAYSNLGMGLLGYALTVAMPQSGPSHKNSGPAAKTNATAVAYDQLLQEYITKKGGFQS